MSITGRKMIYYTGELRTPPTRLKMLGDLHVDKAALKPLANVSYDLVVADQRIVTGLFGKLDFNKNRGFPECRPVTGIRASSLIVCAHGR
jgi:hypothetical protein